MTKFDTYIMFLKKCVYYHYFINALHAYLKYCRSKMYSEIEHSSLSRFGKLFSIVNISSFN